MFIVPCIKLILTCWLSLSITINRPFLFPENLKLEFIASKSKCDFYTKICCTTHFYINTYSNINYFTFNSHLTKNNFTLLIDSKSILSTIKSKCT
jgi:hypothetical protein